MSDPSDFADSSSSTDDAVFDRSAHPALGGFFAGLDDLAAPPADPAVQAAHIARASSIAAGAEAAPSGVLGWRTVGWRVAAVAAASAVVIGGLGADDRLPEPAQRLVSSIADTFGVDVPDGSDRDDDDRDVRDEGRDLAPADDPDTSEDDDQSGDDRPARDDSPRSGSTDPDGTDPGSTDGPNTTARTQNPSDTRPGATPADPGGPGQPATPATPPTNPGSSGNPGNSGNPGAPGNGATPADPGGPGQPATPATPPTAPGNSGDRGNSGNRGSSGASGNPAAPATPADPGGPGTPATPATPPARGNPDRPGPNGNADPRAGQVSGALEKISGKVSSDP